MGEYPADQLDAAARLGQVGIVHDQAAGRGRGLRPVGRLLDQPLGDDVVHGAPIDAAVVHKAVEHVLATGKETVKGGLPVMVGVLDAEQGEEQQQGQFVPGAVNVVGGVPAQGNFPREHRRAQNVENGVHRFFVRGEKAVQLRKYCIIFMSQHIVCILFDNLKLLKISDLTN